MPNLKYYSKFSQKIVYTKFERGPLFVQAETTSLYRLSDELSPIALIPMQNRYYWGCSYHQFTIVQNNNGQWYLSFYEVNNNKNLGDIKIITLFLFRLCYKNCTNWDMVPSESRARKIKIKKKEIMAA